jgi:hypothetical protein
MRLDDITNRIVSASATIIAIAALGTAVYQAKLSRDQAKASAWPYLLQGNSGNNGYASIVQNLGVGPAKIEGFEVTVDSQPVKNWVQAAEAMGVKLSWNGHRTTSFHRGIVVPAGAVIDLLDLPDSTDARLFRSRVDRVRVWVCYCSVYDDCWTVATKQDAPMKVKVCRDDPARKFTE